jgi:hypothetical protein
MCTSIARLAQEGIQGNIRTLAKRTYLCSFHAIIVAQKAYLAFFGPIVVCHCYTGFTLQAKPAAIPWFLVMGFVDFFGFQTLIY